MRRRISRTVPLALLLWVWACTPPETIVTEPGKIAYRADQIAVRVNELQKAAIQAEANGGLPTATTRIIVEFAVSANRILKETPAGWPKTVAQLWTETKARLPPFTDQPMVMVAFDAVDLAIMVSGGPR